MKSRMSRSIYISTLGAIITILSVATLVWGPSDNVSDAIAFMLVAMFVVGMGLLISGAVAALSSAPPDRDS